MNIERLEKVSAEWNKLSKLFSALGDPYRQKMLLLFDPGEELTVKQLSAQIPLSATASAHHIRALKEAGALLARKHGKETYLSVDRPFIETALVLTLEYVRAPETQSKIHPPAKEDVIPVTKGTL